VGYTKVDYLPQEHAQHRPIPSSSVRQGSDDSNDTTGAAVATLISEMIRGQAPNHLLSRLQKCNWLVTMTQSFSDGKL
jgi:hypothetical protein